jgi:D-galactarolactone isomerase
MSGAKPKLLAPAGACDTHMHIYEPEYPTAPTALAPPPAHGTLANYRKVMAHLGTERVIVIQPSAYGDDNRCTLEAVAKLGAGARAVVMLKADVSDAELQRLANIGSVVGLRCFLVNSAGMISWDVLERLVQRVQPLGWHIHLQFDGRLIVEKLDLLKRLPGKIIIDHNAKFLEPVAPDHPCMKALLGLIDGGRWWVKLSAPYETSKVGAPTYADVGALARTFAHHAPDRCLWASNWPHPGQNPSPDDANLLDLLLDWAPDDTARRKILVDNPAALFGF